MICSSSSSSVVRPSERGSPWVWLRVGWRVWRSWRADSDGFMADLLRIESLFQLGGGQKSWAWSALAVVECCSLEGEEKLRWRAAWEYRGKLAE